MSERKRLRIGDIDPVVAPDHTADDIIRALKDLCEHRNNAGFTRKEAHVALRCDTSRLSSLLEALVKAEHLVRSNGRYFPQDSLYTAKHAEIHGEAVFTTRQVVCRRSGCDKYEPIEGKCFVEICSICKNSHTHHSTEEEAWERLRRNDFHANRKAHSYVQEASIG